MRTFGVEEELLLVDDSELDPRPLGWQLAERHGLRAETGHKLTAELQQEQLEVVNPPQHTLSEQLASIRSGRAWAGSCAGRAGARVGALTEHRSA